MGKLGHPDVFMDQVALGLVDSCFILRKFGDNEDVPGTSTTVDVWPGGGRRVLPSVAAVASCVSTDAADDGVAELTGARVIRVEGLDANYKEIEEDVILEGLTPVNTTQSFLRINRAYNILCGSTQYNQGDITCSIGGDVQAFIEALEGQTHQAMYTVPAGFTFLLTDFEVTIGRMTASGDMHVFGEAMVFGTNAWRITENVYLGAGQNFNTDRPTVVAQEKTEIRIGAHSTSSAQMSTMFGGLLIPNNYLNILD